MYWKIFNENLCHCNRIFVTATSRLNSNWFDFLQLFVKTMEKKTPKEGNHVFGSKVGMVQFTKKQRSGLSPRLVAATFVACCSDMLHSVYSEFVVVSKWPTPEHISFIIVLSTN